MHDKIIFNNKPFILIGFANCVLDLYYINNLYHFFHKIKLRCYNGKMRALPIPFFSQLITLFAEFVNT